LTTTATTSWHHLEARIRKLSSLIWDRPAQPRLVNGVQLDCVIELQPDHWICIEISKSNTLDKIREDLAKFAVIKPHLISKNIASRLYFVTEDEPTAHVAETARGLNVDALSHAALARLFFDFESYRTIRSTKPFGSAVELDTGAADQSEYVPVKYVHDRQKISIDDIVAMIATGHRIVLLGEFGSGKSRCFREIFSRLAEHAAATTRYPLAINLREHWGARRGHEILQRHLDELGMGSAIASLAKVLDQDSIIPLLDGFDEISSQTWSDDQNRLRLIRQQSLVGVKDLIARTKAGVIISGREHYFNSTEEMFAALGLDPRSTKIIRCHDEFTADEMKQFLGKRGTDVTLPSWLPRRPLICQTITTLNDSDLATMFETEGGDVQFWHQLIDVTCRREARINPILQGDNIKNVLRLVARSTRRKPQDVGPVTIAEINRAFEQVLGTLPVDESAIMLQRLPGLGGSGPNRRIAPSSTSTSWTDSVRSTSSGSPGTHRHTRWNARSGRTRCRHWDRE